MGGSVYSMEARAARTEEYATRADSDIFAFTSALRSAGTDEEFRDLQAQQAMNPVDIELRECRDSAAHPCAVPVILALDVTGSMGGVPKYLVRQGLPTLIQQTVGKGVPDPAILFMAVGDHECDRYPLQVGQFESGDAELDHWLTSVYLEGGGGGNPGESYMLPWYFAGKYTEHDHMAKRGRKGLLITVGDEPCLARLPVYAQEKLFSGSQFSDASAADCLEMARKLYDVYHLHVSRGRYREGGVVDGWRQLLGDNLVLVDRHEDIPDTVAGLIADHETGEGGAGTPQVQKPAGGDGKVVL